ncbi:transcriptional regulator domain-containing protein (plasmid) [Rhodococcus opacus]|uniref:Transcriptional regulator domain-containing protein n=1 Tax=Rhodococcus opacus TaxID=37919 RepID=A0A1B1KI86_RHOOP|nr:transcriptional regulator domain-containing protein [Rhodococcus opacus]ANS32391.1 transcriptional regulator domain-containing protein [Rhodococcus opacus]
MRRLLDHGNVVTVCAAAGAGKSTAVVTALDDIGRPVAWLSLDGTEAAAGRLLLYLEAAVSPHAPDAEGAATDALAAGLPLGEAAGLLAESLHGSGLVLVCDNVERVVESATAMAVLSALVRYIPPEVGLVLVSRVAVPLDASATCEMDRIGEIADEDLAFDVSEAAEALRLAGRSEIDPKEAVRRAGGWVTGVLFAGNPPAAQSPDRLHRYITAQVLGELPEQERRFLIRTSLLAEVSVEDATALGLADAGRIIGALRSRHLPVVWLREHAFAVGPQFRDYLQALLTLVDVDEYRNLLRNHAGLLIKKGELEEAVDVLLDVGDREQAWQLTLELLPRLVERMDLEPAARWLDSFNDADLQPSPRMASNILRVAFGLEQPTRGVAVLERNGWEWIQMMADFHQDSTDEALVLLVWCLWHTNALEQSRRVANLLRPGRARSIAEIVLGLSSDEPPPNFPEFAPTPSGPLEGLLMRVAYIYGRLQGLDAPGVHGPWRSVLGAPWVIAGLRATGQIEQAMELYELHRDKPQPLWLHGVDAAELMADLGRDEDAWNAVRTGWKLQGPTGSQVYAALLHLVEARLHLRLNRDTEAAMRALDAANECGAQSHSFIREFEMLWRGFAHLIRGEDTDARDMLTAAVASMQKTGHRLELVSAATYLSEANWRTGDEEASDRLAALALRAADDMGSVHLLLSALEDVPSVAVRGADTEPHRTSRWHELTTLLTRRGGLAITARNPRLVLEEFGEPVLLLDTVDVTPRLRKSTELLARLIAAPGRTVNRHEVLDGLFQSRNEPAARSYLRQALYRLREILPVDLSPIMEGDQLSILGPEIIVGTAEEVLACIGQADRQEDETRLITLTEALARSDRGPYLRGMSSSWVEARRIEVNERLLRARLDLARIAYRLGRYWESSSAVDMVLRQEPYREDAWLLRLSLAQASGSDDGVLATYQRYVAAMRELGVPPSAAIQLHVSRMRD